MKIILVNKYWYLRGGTERVVFLTKKILEDSGHTVAIFGPRNAKNDMENEYFCDAVSYDDAQPFGERLRAGVKSIYNTNARDAFDRLVRDFQPDIVHFHNIYHQLSFSLLDVTKKQDIPTVMTVHDYKLIAPNYLMYHHGAIDESIMGKRYYRCLLHNCMEHYGQSIAGTIEAYVRDGRSKKQGIDRYITPSVFARDLMIRAGYEADRLVTIPNPIDGAAYPFSPITEEAEGVGYVGRFETQKGLDVLLDAAKMMPTIPVVLIGDGPEKNHLQSRIQKESLQNVVIRNWESGETLQRSMQSFRLLVVPSVWYENYPLSLVEAKAMGRVVLGSRIGGIPELLPDDLLFEPGNPQSLAKRIETWYSMPISKRNAMEKKLSLETGEQNGLLTYYRAIIRVYETTIGQR